MFPAQANLRTFLAKVTGSDKLVGTLTDAEEGEWNRRANEQTDWWTWFTGEALRVEDMSIQAKNGLRPRKYPLAINPPAIAGRMHSYALVGQAQDSSGPIVRTVFEQRRKETDTTAIEEAEEALLDAKYENDERGQFIDTAIMTQFLGGFFMKIGYDPTDPINRPSGIRTEYYDPREVTVRFRGKDYYNLEEAWIRRRISQEEAALYGIRVPTDFCTYEEYWNKKWYYIRIENDLAKDALGDDINRPNPFGFVPFVYAPHERVNGFWGLPIHKDVVDQVYELNAREADIGDAIHDSVNDVVWVRNTKTDPKVQVISTPTGRLLVLNMGRAISAQDPMPEIGRLPSHSLPQSASDFTARMLEYTRTSMQTPDVTYGKDQGSQRSGETLHARMWPTTAHVMDERIWLGTAICTRDEMILRIMATKGLHGINQKHLGYRKHTVWAPMLPPDRAQIVQEVVARKQQGAISDELMVEKFGDAPDMKRELELIQEMEQAEIDMQTQQKQMEMDSQMAMMKAKAASEPKASSNAK